MSSAPARVINDRTISPAAVNRARPIIVVMVFFSSVRGDRFVLLLRYLGMILVVIGIILH